MCRAAVCPPPPESSQLSVFRALPHEPTSVREARHALDALEEVVDGETLDATRLLVSELVTNCVRHADAGPAEKIELAASASSEGVRVEISDAGAGFEVDSDARSQGDFEGSGWGLHLLSVLSHRWGTERDERMRVWFEIEASLEER
jgi:anti-sigma regulatory factor (Ser/Thr protein kinase)